MKGRSAAVFALAFGLAMTGTTVAWADDPELERRIQRLENILAGDQLVELIQQIDELERQLRELRGEIEEQGHRVEQLRQRQRNLYADLDQRMRALELDEQRAAVEPPPTVDQAVDTPAPEATESEREAYDAAFSLLREGRYRESAEAFEALLEEHPDGDYAANAQYWIGETHYVSRDFDRALRAFLAVTDEYPDSAKVPDARLKIGYTLYEKGRYEEARNMLDAVREEYRGSSVARLAEERLVRMREEGH